MCVNDTPDWPKPPFSYDCPFCGQPVTITDSDIRKGDDWGFSDDSGRRAVEWRAYKCPGCGFASLILKISQAEWEPSKSSYSNGRYVPVALERRLRLIPPSGAKAFPEYVPAGVRSDNEEASLIQDLSPKASATLARRALQGMIRDFWGVPAQRNLKMEIAAIEDKVDGDTLKAVDAVRSVGNIGAHMEADIDVIVEVGPEEAGLLIWLIETLVEDWYISREEKISRLREIAELAERKKVERRPSTPAQQPTSSDEHSSD